MGGLELFIHLFESHLHRYVLLLLVIGIRLQVARSIQKLHQLVFDIPEHCCLSIQHTHKVSCIVNHFSLLGEALHLVVALIH